MFYRIQSIRNKEITGVNDVQSETAFSPINIWDPLHINQWIGKEIPDYAVIPIPKIKIKAKLTDLMSVYFFGSSFKLTISNKLKLIFEKYSRDKIQYLPIVMQQSGKQVDGYWITNILDFDNEKTINYSLSEVVREGKGYNEFEKLDIVSYHQHLFERQKERDTYLNECRPIVLRKLVFKNELELEFVMINFIREGGVGYYVSESLKKILEEEGCTGIDFVPVLQG